MDGVVKELPTSPIKAVPPVATSYQRYCPFTAPDAVRVTKPAPHDEPPVAVGAEGGVLIVAITEVLVLSQVPELTET